MKSSNAYRLAGSLVIIGMLGAFFQNCAKKVDPSIVSGSSVAPSSVPLAVTGNSASVLPGNSASVIISLNRASTSDVTFTYSTQSDTAIANTHFTPAASVTGQFAAGELTAQIQVPTTNTSGLVYTGKSFYVNFTFTDASIPSVQAQVTFQAPSVAPSTFQNSSNSGQIAAGDLHTCALKKSGGLFCWGYNSNGQLGNGNVTTSALPVLVSGMETGVEAVTAGYRFSCAIKSGALFCWGLNGNAQLGNGSTTASSFPVAVFNMTSGVQAVSAGYDHACAIKLGALYCWGGNSLSQVGLLSGANQVVPYRVPGFETGVTAVAASHFSTCAVKNGALYCWGNNSKGQLGIGNTTSDKNRNPTTVTIGPVVGMDSGVVAIAAHGLSTCASKNGQLYCWGWNGYGQLGLGNKVDVTAPNQVAAVGMPLGHFSIAQEQTCAIKSSSLYCWGTNNSGQLGNGTLVTKLVNDNVAVPVTLQAGESIEFVSTGGIGVNSSPVVSHTCARTSLKRVFCWGFNSQGEVGDGTVAGGKVSPIEIPSLAQ